MLIALPMFGDYYTNDVISGSPQTSMIGNQINLYFQGGTGRTVGACLVIVLSVLLAAADVVLPLGHGARLGGDEASRCCEACARLVREPVGPAARCSAPITWLYMAWSIVPGVDRDSLLLQRRPLAQRLAGVLDALVLGRPEPARCSTTRRAERARAEPQARGARHADRGPARRRARHRPDAVARVRRPAGELPDALPARDARDRDGGVAAARLRPPVRDRRSGRRPRCSGRSPSRSRTS